MKNSKPSYKLITLGDSFAGKSCIIHRFIHDEFENLKNTIGVEYSTKDCTFNGKEIKLKIFDTSGQEHFKSITSNYYKKADGILFIFDLTRKETLKNIEDWIKEIREQPSVDIDKVGMVLLGNKSDLRKEKKIDLKEGIALANKLNTKYFETSALSGYNIEKAFQYLVEDIINKRGEEENLYNSDDAMSLADIKTSQNKGSKKCCSK